MLLFLPITTAPKHIPAHVPSQRPIHFDCCRLGASAMVIICLVTGLKLFKCFENALSFKWLGLKVAM